MRLAGEPFLQGLDRARFSDPGFADHRYDLALTLPRLLPAFEYQPHFMGAADQRQIPAGANRGKTTFDRCLTSHPPGRHRAGEAFQLMSAGVLEFKHPAQQVPGRLADENGIRPGQRLQPRSEVGCLANNGAFLSDAGADDLPDHDEPGGDADPCLDPRLIRQLDIADFREDADPRPYRAFRRILEGARKAEISQDPVAHELGNEAAIASDRT